MVGRTQSLGTLAPLTIIVGNAPAAGCAPAQPNRDGVAAETSGLRLSILNLMRRKPDVISGAAHLWRVAATPAQRTFAVDARGDKRRHIHPDGDHHLFVIEGEASIEIGDQLFLMKPGDYNIVPGGMAHATHVRPRRRAIFLTMDAPAFNPANIVWLIERVLH